MDNCLIGNYTTSLIFIYKRYSILILTSGISDSPSRGPNISEVKLQFVFLVRKLKAVFVKIIAMLCFLLVMFALSLVCTFLGSMSGQDSSEYRTAKYL